MTPEYAKEYIDRNHCWCDTCTELRKEAEKTIAEEKRRKNDNK
jgi:hypothetical protein